MTLRGLGGRSFTGREGVVGGSGERGRLIQAKGGVKEKARIERDRGYKGTKW